MRPNIVGSIVILFSLVALICFAWWIDEIGRWVVGWIDYDSALFIFLLIVYTVIRVSNVRMPD